MQTTPAQDYTRKLAAAHAQAQAAVLKPRVYDPWLDRLLRKLGFHLPPILFVPLPWLGFWLAVYFALAWGLGMHFMIWGQDMPLKIQLMASVFSGIMFGSCMAVYYRHYRRKHRLSPWRAL